LLLLFSVIFVLLLSVVPSSSSNAAHAIVPMAESSRARLDNRERLFLLGLDLLRGIGLDKL
jgi:hypothetical protein